MNVVKFTPHVVDLSDKHSPEELAAPDTKAQPTVFLPRRGSMLVLHSPALSDGPVQNSIVKSGADVRVPMLPYLIADAKEQMRFAGTFFAGGMLIMSAGRRLTEVAPADRWLAVHVCVHAKPITMSVKTEEDVVENVLRIWMGFAVEVKP